MKFVTAVPLEFFCDFIAYVTDPCPPVAAVIAFVCALVENVGVQLCGDVIAIGFVAFPIVVLTGVDEVFDAAL